jgi:hypothetical protein
MEVCVVAVTGDTNASMDIAAPVPGTYTVEVDNIDRWGNVFARSVGSPEKMVDMQQRVHVAASLR